MSDPDYTPRERERETSDTQMCRGSSLSSSAQSACAIKYHLMTGNLPRCSHLRGVPGTVTVVIGSCKLKPLLYMLVHLNICQLIGYLDLYFGS